MIDIDVLTQGAQPLRLEALDSLRGLIVVAEKKEARLHLVQEYLFAANQLDAGARVTAIAAVQQVLAKSR